MNVPQLVCFDLPCLVQVEGEVPAQALERALRRLGLDETAPQHSAALETGLFWPGRDAREVLRGVFRSSVWADAAAAAYDDAFGACVSRGGVTLRQGAQSAVTNLRAAAARISLTTQFSASTREALLDVLGWSDLVAMLVSEDSFDDAAEHDAVGTAIRRTVEPRCAAVVSDSLSGVSAGRHAGAGWVVGVTGSGAPAVDLLRAGATAVATLSELAFVPQDVRLSA